ncbi:MAG TPA: radical SAM protein, partial [Dissulfurispiraceae bacterium]
MDCPSRLFVEVTTRCNLRCGMCVKQTDNTGIAEGAMPRETFAALRPAFPYLKALILNGIGEPLLHPHLEEFIRTARKTLPEGAWVGFQTNGMLLDEARADALLDAGLDRICLSMDAVSQGSFGAIRDGGEVRKMEAAFTALDRAMQRKPRDFRIGIEFVLRRDNLRELPAALRWAADRGATFAIVTQLLPYGKALVQETAYDTNTRGAISVYESWRERAKAEDVDIRRYLEVYMKFTKTDEDLKVLSFVERMKEDERAHGFALHLERL